MITRTSVESVSVLSAAESHLGTQTELTMEARRNLCVYNRTQEAFLSFTVSRANTILGRMRGLLGRMNLKSSEGLWLVPACGVHTVGLRFTIDVVYLDAEHRVVHLVEQLRPFRMSPLHLGATSILELPPHTIYASQTRVGDSLLICAAEEIEQQLVSNVQASGATTRRQVENA